MQTITPEFLDSCPQRDGFRQRGSEMTRVEVFVDAAFAFAVTLLVISFDAIPQTFAEMVIAIKMIPAFVTAVAQLVWIWYTHTLWCQRYGLDDGPTVWLSALLLTVVLIYIYPMRVLLEGLFMWISGGFFPSSFELTSLDELRFMFVFLSIVFTAVCGVFMAMYGYAYRRSDELLLNTHERNWTSKIIWEWAGCGGIALACALLAMLLPERLVPWCGFTYALIGVWMPLVESRYRNKQSQGAPDD